MEFFQSRIEIEKSGEQINTSERVAIATCALLLEMAHADSEFSDIEEKRITAILQNEFSLSKEDANELIELSNLERKESLDLWQFTNLINEYYSKAEKAKVLETLWRVIYADDKVDKYEEYLMRRLSYLLNMDHKDMIEAKFRARDHSPD
jgi:uncharacterized tellurite resistance protein B-like protein